MSLADHVYRWSLGVIPAVGAACCSALLGDWRLFAFVASAGVGYAGTFSIIYATQRGIERWFSVDERVEERVGVVGGREGDRVPVTDPTITDTTEL